MAYFTLKPFSLPCAAHPRRVSPAPPICFSGRRGKKSKNNIVTTPSRFGVTPKTAGPELARIHLDTIVGMAFNSLVSLAIVFATAATLHPHGVVDVTTSAQAAEALRPIAGEFAFALFAPGIIGTGLLAVPVLAGSAAYAISEIFGWADSLDARPNDARAFYATIAVATLLGAALS